MSIPPPDEVARHEAGHAVTSILLAQEPFAAPGEFRMPWPGVTRIALLAGSDPGGITEYEPCPTGCIPELLYEGKTLPYTRWTVWENSRPLIDGRVMTFLAGDVTQRLYRGRKLVSPLRGLVCRRPPHDPDAPDWDRQMDDQEVVLLLACFVTDPADEEQVRRLLHDSGRWGEGRHPTETLSRYRTFDAKFRKRLCAYLRPLQVRTAHLIQENWQAVEALARVLLERSELGGEEAKAIIAGA